MGFILSFIIGIVFSVIGVLQLMGNTSMIHSYHRKRVSEEDMLPFARIMGAGSLVLGATLLTSGTLIALTFFTEQVVYAEVADFILTPGLIIGVIVELVAIIKYNKGLF